MPTVSNFGGTFTATNGPFQVGTRIVVIGYTNPTGTTYKLAAAHTTDPAVGWTINESDTILTFGDPGYGFSFLQSQVIGRHVNGQSLISAAVVNTITGSVIGRYFNPSTLTWTAQQTVFTPSIANGPQLPKNATYNDSGTITYAFGYQNGYPASFAEGGGAVNGAYGYATGAVNDSVLIDDPLAQLSGHYGLMVIANTSGVKELKWRQSSSYVSPPELMTSGQQTAVAFSFGQLGQQGCWDAVRGMFFWPSLSGSTLNIHYGQSSNSSSFPQGSQFSTTPGATGIGSLGWAGCQRASDGRIFFLYTKSGAIYKKILNTGVTDYVNGWTAEAQALNVAPSEVHVITLNGQQVVAGITSTTYYDDTTPTNAYISGSSSAASLGILSNFTANNSQSAFISGSSQSAASGTLSLGVVQSPFISGTSIALTTATFAFQATTIPFIIGSSNAGAVASLTNFSAVDPRVARIVPASSLASGSGSFTWLAPVDPLSGTFNYRTSRTLVYISLTVDYPTQRTILYVAPFVSWQTNRVLWVQIYSDFETSRTVDIPPGDPSIPNYRPPSKTLAYLHTARILDALNAATVFIPSSHTGTISEAVNPKGVIKENVQPGAKITALTNPAGKVTERANPPGKVLNE
mgnify:CR=1 FL=1